MALDLEQQLQKLTEDQNAAIERLVAEGDFTAAALVATEPGGGKTRVAVSVVKQLGYQCVLILAPDSTEQSWRKELLRQEVDLPFTRVRKAEDAQPMDWGTPGVYFMSKQLLTRLSEISWKDERGKRRFKTTNILESWNPEMVINDEAHEGGTSGTTVTWRALKKLKPENVGDRYLLSLSGTPEGKSFEGAHRVTMWLWGDRESTWVDNSLDVWRRKWCLFSEKYNPHARGYDVVGEKEPGAYYRSLPCVLSWEVPYIPVDDQIIEVDLHPSQRKAYDDLEKNMIAWVKDSMVTTDLPVVQRIRMRQATLGLFSVSDDGEITFSEDCESSKIDMMFSVLADDFGGEPAVLFTDSRKFGEVVVKRLSASGKRVAFWAGGLSTKKKDAILTDFNEGSYDYVLMVVSAGGTGTDGLQEACNNVLYLSSDDSWVKMKQSKARVARVGVTGTVRIRRLIARDTYDAGIRSKELQNAIAAKKRLLALSKKRRTP